MRCCHRTDVVRMRTTTTTSRLPSCVAGPSVAAVFCQEVNELLRAGLSAAVESPPGSAESYALPAFDPGRPLIADHRAMKELLEEEDVARALRACSP